MEKIYWIENVVQAQKSDMTLVSTEILQCGRETNHSTDFSKCHILGSSEFGAWKDISNKKQRNPGVLEQTNPISAI